MSIKSVSTNNLSTRAIPTPTVPEPRYFTDSPVWTRPVDWLTLPTVSDTDQTFVGLLAITENYANYTSILAQTLGITTTNVSITDGRAGYPGNILNPGTFILGPRFEVGMFVTGAGITGTPIITSESTVEFVGTVSGTTLTVTSIISGTLTVGTSIRGDTPTSYTSTSSIASFGTGTGGVGTYNLRGIASGIPTNGLRYTVDSVQMSDPVTATGSFGYQVDWGDGSAISRYPTNTQANHTYDYAAISNSTITADGYKQVIVTVTPYSTLALYSLFAIDLQSRYLNTAVAPGTFTNGMPGNWLDIIVGSPYLTSLLIGSSASGPTLVNSMNRLEQVSIMSVKSTYTNWAYMFFNCFALRSVPNMPLQYVTGLGNLFQNCYKLTHVPPLLNMANVTNVSTMFQSCVALTNIDNFINANTAKVNSLGDTFNGCSKLVYIPYFNTANVTSWGRTFANCNSLISTANFNTTKATSFNLMFQGSKALESVPNYDSANVNTFNGMFVGCTNLKTVPLLNYSNVTTTNSMFSSCQRITDMPAINVPKVTDMAFMFAGCNTLANITSISNTANVTTMSTMFSQCQALVDAPALDTTKVTDMSGMFASCIKLSNVANIDNYNTANVTLMQNMFNQCAAMQFPPNLNTIKTTNVNSMFNQCKALTTVPLYNIANCLDMSSTFSGCNALVTVPEFITTKVTSMNSTFNACNQLTSVPLLDTGNVTSMQATFQSCTALQTIPTFNTSKVTAINTFMNGGSISIIPALNLINVTATTSAFSSANLTNFNATNAKVSLSFISCTLDKTALETIFTNLQGNITSQTITITSNPGADTAVAKTGNTTNNSKVIVMANTVGLSTGMYVTAAGLNSLITTHNGIAVVVSSGFLPTANSVISFNAFTNVTNLSLNTIYYVKNPLSNQFQISLTPGGAAVQLNNTSTAGTCTLRYPNQITAVNANANITISEFANFTNTAVAISGRRLNTQLAIMKNWTVTG